MTVAYVFTSIVFPALTINGEHKFGDWVNKASFEYPFTATPRSTHNDDELIVHLSVSVPETPVLKLDNPEILLVELLNTCVWFGPIVLVFELVDTMSITRSPTLASGKTMAGDVLPDAVVTTPNGFN